MHSFLDSIWYYAGDAQDKTWQWFNGLNREEWLVVLAITCACGFMALLGFNLRRL
jgi:hypothetical protein